MAHHNTNSFNNSARTSSQTSVYDYPEHLNPFYEDENHKRIRFWNIGKKSQTMGRRSSFSLSGIKDMWAFKSFTLKKRSSTLGINKTSESPPALRRDQYEPNYNTIGSGYRNTVSTVGLNNNFLRNSTARTSYQDINRNKVDTNIAFNRNDRYRSTVQNVIGGSRYSPEPDNRYVYRGSVTPTPRSKYLANRGMTAGSSQLSVGSTNPFEDDDDVSICIEETAIASTSNGTQAKKPTKTPRKKRRAPPPPTNVPKLQSTSINVHTTELRIEEEPSPPKSEEELEIHNLTAQIENFVHRSSHEEVNETPKLENNPEQTTAVTLQPIMDDTKIKTTSETVTKPSDDQVVKEQNIAHTKIENTTTDAPQVSTYATESSVQDIKAPVRRKEKLLVRSNSPISAQVEQILEEAVQAVAAQNDLKIVESSSSESDVTATRNNNIEFDNVNLNSNEAINKDYRKVLTETKMSHTRETSIERNDAQSMEVIYPPPGRRRSVKDIIESINRSQSLLKVNHEPEYKFTNNGHNNSDMYFRLGEPSNHKIQNNVMTAKTSLDDLSNSELQLKAMIEELEKGNAKDRTEEYNRNSYYDNLPELMEKFDELNNKNSILFEKCTLRSSVRKTNRIDANDANDDKAGLGVNPLPKPRRSMNLSDYSANTNSPPISPLIKK